MVNSKILKIGLTTVFSLILLAMTSSMIFSGDNENHSAYLFDIYYKTVPPVEVYSIIEKPVIKPELSITENSDFKFSEDSVYKDKPRTLTIHVPKNMRGQSNIIELSDRDFDCLARNIYYESAGEPYLGQLAVAHVTWNRLSTGIWGKSICSVVFWPSQFSWTLDAKKRNARPSGDSWEFSKKVARDFMNGHRVVGMERTKFFHATRIKPPSWTTAMDRTHEIGGHVFYARK